MILGGVLDDDIYKFRMCDFLLNKYKDPSLSPEVQYKLFNRSPADQWLLKDQSEEIRETLIQEFKALKITTQDIVFLKNLNFSTEFLRFISAYNFANLVPSFNVNTNGDFQFSGPWVEAILIEVKAMAIISEICMRQKYIMFDDVSKLKIHSFDYEFYHDSIIDFGTRRRFSRQTQMDNGGYGIYGTSNMLKANSLNMRCLGTIAHELYMGLCLYKENGQLNTKDQTFRSYLEVTNDFFKGENIVFLTDTFKTDNLYQWMIKNKEDPFVINFVKKIKSFRQDSGDPILYVTKTLEMLSHFLNEEEIANISFLFSDGLNEAKIRKIYFSGELQNPAMFGIGTELTNFSQLEPMNIVIKLTRVQKSPVFKLSDDSGKVTTIYAKAIEDWENS